MYSHKTTTLNKIFTFCRQKHPGIQLRTKLLASLIYYFLCPSFHLQAMNLYAASVGSFIILRVKFSSTKSTPLILPNISYMYYFPSFQRRELDEETVNGHIKFDPMIASIRHTHILWSLTAIKKVPLYNWSCPNTGAHFSVCAHWDARGLMTTVVTTQ
jgi:hypothetical protein